MNVCSNIHCGGNNLCYLETPVDHKWRYNVFNLSVRD